MIENRLGLDRLFWEENLLITCHLLTSLGTVVIFLSFIVLTFIKSSLRCYAHCSTQLFAFSFRPLKHSESHTGISKLVIIHLDSSIATTKPNLQFRLCLYLNSRQQPIKIPRPPLYNFFEESCQNIKN